MSRIAIVTDSSSQITSDIVTEFDVRVVPMTVTVDGTDYREGVELDADGFYAFFDVARPEISTSQPAPGDFVELYQQLADEGFDEVVAIHISEAMSGTIGSATLAARSAPIPVTIIDTGSASFGVAICVWAAGAVVRRGGSVADVERRVAALVPRIATAFMVGVPLLTEQSGRARGVEIASDDEGISVLAMADGNLEVLDRVNTVDETVAVMARYATSWGEGITVAIGTADEPSRPLTALLEDALSDAGEVDAVVHYRVGPSVGAHTGPGTFGLFVFPTIR